MHRRSIAIFALILCLVPVGVGAANAQEATDTVPPPARELPSPPDGQPRPPDGQEPPQLPVGLPQPPGGQPQPPQNGQPFPRGQFRPPQVYVQPTTTTATTTTVYPSQVLILRHIEQTIANALGLTRSDVNTLRLSMTFDEVVTAYGGDVSAVRSQAIADLIAWVSNGMNDGTITQARGELIISSVYDIVGNAFSGAFNVSGTTVTGLLDS